MTVLASDAGRDENFSFSLSSRFVFTRREREGLPVNETRMRRAISRLILVISRSRYFSFSYENFSFFSRSRLVFTRRDEKSYFSSRSRLVATLMIVEINRLNF